MIPALLSILFALSVPQCDRVDSCDIVEINSIIDGSNGRAKFQQVIFWEFNERDFVRRQFVVGWRNCNSCDVYLHRFAPGAWVEWTESEQRRGVYAPFVVESLTWNDPELLDRDSLPDCHRRPWAWQGDLPR